MLKNMKCSYVHIISLEVQAPFFLFFFFVLLTVLRLAPCVTKYLTVKVYLYWHATVNGVASMKLQIPQLPTDSILHPHLNRI